MRSLKAAHSHHSRAAALSSVRAVPACTPHILKRCIDGRPQPTFVGFSRTISRSPVSLPRGMQNAHGGHGKSCPASSSACKSSIGFKFADCFNQLRDCAVERGGGVLAPTPWGYPRPSIPRAACCPRRPADGTGIAQLETRLPHAMRVITNTAATSS